MKFKKYYTDTDSLTSFPALIQASGEPLVDYTITGNTGGVGDRTKNLYDADSATDELLQDSGNIISNSNYKLSPYIAVDSSITISAIESGSGGATLRIGLYDANHDFIIRNVYDDALATITASDCAYIRINYQNAYYTNVQAEIGTSASTYEPYGYKVPVNSGGVTTNLYIDSPLGLTDTLTYTQTGIAIPTFDGDNTISFGTTIQPSGMSAEFKGWHSQDNVRVYNGNTWD